MNEEKNLNDNYTLNSMGELKENSAAAVAEEAEEIAEAVEETAAEETVETAETVEETAEAVEETAETVEVTDAEETEEPVAEITVEEAPEADAQVLTDAAKKKPLPTAKIAVAAAAVLVVAAIAVFAFAAAPKIFNKYNSMGYVDVSGRTIAEVAESSGMELADFLESYGLPANMPGNTSESAAYYTIPCSRMATMYGMDFATLKSTLELPDTVTEDTTWGEAEGEARLSVYVGEDNLSSFKEQYGLGDEVTGDTQWKDIRNIVDEYNRQKRIESENAAASNEQAGNADAEAPADAAGDNAAEGAAEASADNADAAPAE